MRAKEFVTEEYVSNLPSVDKGEALRPLLAKAAQKVYDNWNEKDVDTYAGGGICHLIADEFASILWDNNIEATTISSNFEQHVYVVAKFDEGVYSIDLHPSYYETGGGFSWKKIPNVVLHPNDISFYMVSGDPDEFDQMTEEF